MRRRAARSATRKGEAAAKAPAVAGEAEVAAEAAAPSAASATAGGAAAPRRSPAALLGASSGSDSEGEVGAGALISTDLGATVVMRGRDVDLDEEADLDRVAAEAAAAMKATARGGRATAKGHGPSHRGHQGRRSRPRSQPPPPRPHLPALGPPRVPRAAASGSPTLSTYMSVAASAGHPYVPAAEDAELIAAAVAMGGPVELRLGGNRLGDASAMALAHALAFDTWMRGGCGGGGGGAQ